MNDIGRSLPPQQIPFSKKNKQWRKKHLDFADSKSLINYSVVRKDVVHKRINYDLINGKINMKDIMLVLNPESIQAGFIPDKIQHYPIINSKLLLLQGEENSRVFDYKVVVTNPNSVSEIEREKQEQVIQAIQEWIQTEVQSEEEAQQKLQQIGDHYTYDWQDQREIRANALLNHYVKEYNMPYMFNQGFMDAMTVAEEIYQCDIVGGEPVITRLNPTKVRVFRSGSSNKIEDADMIIIEDYWSPGKIIDAFYDVLSKKDIKYIESIPNSFQSSVDSLDNIDERYAFVDANMIGEEFTSQENFFWNPSGAPDGLSNTMPYDQAGNIRVLRVYWKSRRKIKKVKSYDEITGEEQYDFYPETHIIDETKGEEVSEYYINQAWEGTKIGSDIYINMRPRVVQYNSLSNPSKCHFGIIGSVYNINESKPFSLVDMMKPYNYLYDVVKDRLNKLLARNWGTILRLDLSKKPRTWDVEKWLYYAKTMGLAVEDSFNEGQYGAASGKLAGALNNASTGVISASDAASVQGYIQLLEYIRTEMSEIVGISRQREGQISNRETVGGVERATLQSSHTTEWLFITHDDVKKRALECFIETAKIALRGRSKKFQYILSDGSMKVMDIDGDEFSENDYGLVVDNSQSTQELAQKMDMLAQAALQNQILNFSSIMKLYSSISIAEKQRIVEKNEQEIMQKQQEAQQQQQQMEQQKMEAEAQAKEAEIQQKDILNQRDNETKVIVAEIAAQASNNQLQAELTAQNNKATLEEKMRQFNEKISLEKEKLEFDKRRADIDTQIKKQSLKNKNIKK